MADTAFSLAVEGLTEPTKNQSINHKRRTNKYLKQTFQE
ncbi:hypothetical protein SynRS9902_02579 [Synechococcus sp. RS9902]|nr:hypothetical protein SynRS9902_02579 [Synechococcus sp. RS9902]